MNLQIRVVNNDTALRRATGNGLVCFVQFLCLEVVSNTQKGKKFEVDRKGAKLMRKGLTLMMMKATGEIRFPVKTLRH